MKPPSMQQEGQQESELKSFAFPWLTGTGYEKPPAHDPDAQRRDEKRRSPKLAVRRRPSAKTLGIRQSILLGFALMCGFTASVGYYSAMAIRQSSGLVIDLFDRSLMPVSCARAAAADFAAMQTNALRRRVTTDPLRLRELEESARDLALALDTDLGVSAQRAQSHRVDRQVARIRLAVQGWQEAINGLDPAIPPADALLRLDAHAASVSGAIEQLIDLTAGSGFLTREQALRSIRTETIIDLCAALAGLVLSAAVTWFLNRRICGPVSAASTIAERIAGGDLDVTFPDSSRNALRCDELGSLLQSMASMRDSIRAMMQAEVSERRSAQARLMDAIETTHEGVVLVDPVGRIVVTNAPIHHFFGAPEPGIRGCFTISDLLRHLAQNRLSEESLQSVGAMTWKLDRDTPGTMELSLRDGMWLRVSWCATREGGLVAFFSDITLSRRREYQLAQTNIWFDAALAHMTQGLCVYDHDGNLKIFNSRFAEIYQIHRDQVRTGTPFEVVQKMLDALSDPALAEGDQAVPTISKQIAARQVFLAKQVLADGRVIAISHRPISDGGWVLTYEDVTARARSEARIAHMAQHDPLTGLPNRALFTEQLDQSLAGLSGGRRFALMLVDLDRFKEVNDRFGHAMGDKLLRVVAERLAGTGRFQDVMARLGGDEFAIIQTGLHEVHDAQDLAARVIASLGNPYTIDGLRLEVGASIGIALAPDHGSDQEILLRNADTALYRVKAEGRGQYRVFSPSMDSALQDRRALDHDLQSADFDAEMDLVYQPIFDIGPDAPADSGWRLSGCEALLRWNHPQRGLMMPSDFVSIAEDSGQIERLGAWILRRACADAAAWPATLKIAVNVSPTQFRSGRLADRLEEAFLASGIEAERLELEITETTLLDDNEATIETLRHIQGRGVKIALDDFGTGFSSLSYLRSFPFDRIKIDRSFVMDLGQREDAPAIIRAIIGLGRSLHIPVIAEGVETPEQLAHLRAEGCALAQGYLFSRPVPASELLAMAEAEKGLLF